MGQPVVHFEVIGKDGEAAELLRGALRVGRRRRKPDEVRDRQSARTTSRRWREHRRRHRNGAPTATRATSPSTSAVPDIEAALQKAESLGGTRVMGPEKVMDQVELGQFKDPEGNLIGLGPRPPHFRDAPYLRAA